MFEIRGPGVPGETPGAASVRRDAVTVVRAVLVLVASLASTGCVTQRAMRVVDEIDPPTPCRDMLAIGRFAIGDHEVQLVATDFHCVATVRSGSGGGGCTLERVPRERFPEALVEGDEVLAAYAAEQIIPPALVLVRDREGAKVLVTREPDGSWSRHPVSTFQERSCSGVPRAAVKVAEGALIFGSVVADTVIIATVVGSVAGLVVVGCMAGAHELNVGAIPDVIWHLLN